MESHQGISNDKHVLKRIDEEQSFIYTIDSPIESVSTTNKHKPSLESSAEEHVIKSITPKSIASSRNSSTVDDDLININFDIEEGRTDSKYNLYIKSRNDNNFEIIKNQNSDLENRYNITDISFHAEYILSNSPINSSDNSDIELEDSQFNDNKIHQQNIKKELISLKREQSFYTDYTADSRTSSDNYIKNDKYKKLTYKDVQRFIEKYYDINTDSKYSNEIDILTTFINGQKNLYIQAKYITQYKLNLLTFPSIFFTAFATLGSPFTGCESWSNSFMTALNATILLLIALVNYLKYESAIEIYLQNARQYDKLLNRLEMANNKLLFIKNDGEKNMLVLEKIKEIEEQNNEISRTNNILIPEEVKNLFPVICNVNVFSFIKKIEYYKKTLISKLKDVKNEIRFILYKWDNEKVSTAINQSPSKCVSEIKNVEYFREKSRLQFLYEVKTRLKNEILELMHAYTYIDIIFSKEISKADSKKKWLWFYYFFFCFKKIDRSYCKTNNLVIDKYFNLIFSDS